MGYPKLASTSPWAGGGGRSYIRRYDFLIWFSAEYRHICGECIFAIRRTLFGAGTLGFYRNILYLSRPLRFPTMVFLRAGPLALSALTRTS